MTAQGPRADAVVPDAKAGVAAAHPALDRLARALAERPGRMASVEDTVRRAAVALVLRDPLARGAGDENSLELLLIKRAEYAGDPWSGHVACPGGRHEPRDQSLEDTAVRETFEETGIDLRRDGRVLGALDELYPRTPSLPPILIRPFVAVLLRDGPLVLSDEVAGAFWVPLGALRDPAAWIESRVAIRGEDRPVPSFRHGAHTVWGLTERILRQFLGYLE
jgi:8-oxo-dGTP pyrophosphatase MutT (NUDIX family)